MSMNLPPTPPGGAVPPPPPPPPPPFGMNPAPVPSGGVLAGFGSRALAAMVDWFGPVWLVGVVTGWFPSDSGIAAIFRLLTIVAIGWACYTAYLAGTTGTSPGRRLAGIRLERFGAPGVTIGAGPAIARTLLNLLLFGLFFLPGLINVLWTLWHPYRQTLSDQAVRSVVVKV